MRVDYISLTQAINFFEEYRIKNIDIIKIVEEGRSINPTAIQGKTSIEKYNPFFAFIKDNIPIYGKKYPDDRYSILEKIPLSITSRLIDSETFEIFGDSRAWELEPVPKYTIFNRYDYNDYYNPSTNYDALKELRGKVLYTDISIKETDFIKFIDLYDTM